jgi:hypothetical protein
VLELGLDKCGSLRGRARVVPLAGGVLVVHASQSSTSSCSSMVAYKLVCAAPVHTYVKCRLAHFAALPSASGRTGAVHMCASHSIVAQI